MCSLTSLPSSQDPSGHKKNFIASDWTKIQDGKWKADIWLDNNSPSCGSMSVHVTGASGPISSSETSSISLNTARIGDIFNWSNCPTSKKIWIWILANQKISLYSAQSCSICHLEFLSNHRPIRHLELLSNQMAAFPSAILTSCLITGLSAILNYCPIRYLLSICHLEFCPIRGDKIFFVSWCVLTRQKWNQTVHAWAPP